MSLKDKAEDLSTAQDSTPLEFWNGFLHGSIVPFRHREYIRVAYITLGLPENQDRGLLEIATDFANSIHAFKLRNSQFQLLPESRTVAVFWLYQVKYALERVRESKAYKDKPNAPPFPVVLSHAPELLKEKLPEDYYSKGVLGSDEANEYWMLPNLKPLPENSTSPKPLSFAGFGNKTKPDPSDFYLERYLRLALVVVQRYLRPGETRRRSWFIKLAFDSLQRQTMQQRSDNSAVPLYSETQAYFYLQLVHAALSQLQTAGKTDMLQNMTYLSFQQLFAIKPSIWKKHYSPKVWDSVQSRGRFNPPDLKPLPTTIPLTSVIESNSIRQASLLADPNEPFRKLGLIPELPSFDIMYFYHSIFLEDCKSISLPISPSSLPTHAHLLKYVHSFVVTSGSVDTIPARAKQALALLTSGGSDPGSECTVSVTKLTFLLNLALALTPGISLAYPDLVPPRNEDYFPPPPADSNLWGGTPARRLHNCPCHAEVGMPSWTESPRNAVVYPDRYPYTAPKSQVYHACTCHKDVPLDQDKLAAVMAEKYKELEDQEKVPRGTCCGGGDQNGEKEDGGFQVWVRRNLVLVCEEELGGAWYGERWGGEEGRKKWVRPDRRPGFLVLVEPEEGVDVLAETGGREDDARTLAGEDGNEEEEQQQEEEDDWEAVSQSGTLC